MDLGTPTILGRGRGAVSFRTSENPNRSSCHTIEWKQRARRQANAGKRRRASAKRAVSRRMVIMKSMGSNSVVNCIGSAVSLFAVYNRTDSYYLHFRSDEATVATIVRRSELIGFGSWMKKGSLRRIFVYHVLLTCTSTYTITQP